MENNISINIKHGEVDITTFSTVNPDFDKLIAYIAEHSNEISVEDLHVTVTPKHETFDEKGFKEIIFSLVEKYNSKLKENSKYIELLKSQIKTQKPE
jgi:NRPS condensation-like uncharacterized protein